MNKDGFLRDFFALVRALKKFFKTFYDTMSEPIGNPAIQKLHVSVLYTLCSMKPLAGRTAFGNSVRSYSK